MPLGRFLLIVVAALAAAGLTVVVTAIGLPALQMPGLGLGVAALLAAIAYVLVRVISDRMRRAGDDPTRRDER